MNQWSYSSYPMLLSLHLLVYCECTFYVLRLSLDYYAGYQLQWSWIMCHLVIPSSWCIRSDTGGFLMLDDIWLFERYSVNSALIKQVEWWRWCAWAGESFTCIGLSDNGEWEEGLSTGSLWSNQSLDTSDVWMILLCLSVVQPNPLGSRSWIMEMMG